MREFPATAPVPAETRQFLPSLRVVTMLRTANAFGKRQLMVRTPGEEPCLHVLMPDVMPGFYLAVGLADFRQHLFLVGNVGLDCICDQEVRAPPGGLRQL